MKKLIWQIDPQIAQFKKKTVQGFSRYYLRGLADGARHKIN